MVKKIFTGGSEGGGRVKLGDERLERSKEINHASVKEEAKALGQGGCSHNLSR